MRHLLLSALLLAAPLIARPAMAQDDAPSPWADALGQVLERHMDDLFGRIAPHLDAIGQDLGESFAKFRPILEDLVTQMDDIRNYQMPERLENGDILIRRRPDAPPPPPLSDETERLTDPGADGVDPPKPEPVLPRLPDGPSTEL